MTRIARSDGRVRAVIDAVRPSIDCGRFAAKRVVGDDMVVEADCFTDGHDVVRVMLRWRAESDDRFSETEMAPLGNDLWRGAFTLRALGRYVYTVAAWVDHFESWRHELERRVDADDIRIAARIGAELIAAAAARARGGDRKALCGLGRAPRCRCGQRERRRRATEGRGARRRRRAHRRRLSRPAPADDVRDRAEGGRRARTGALQHVVRAVPALDGATRRRARHVSRRRGAPALRRGARLRRHLLPADPSDRPHPAQGPQQRARRRGRRRRQPVGDRRRRRRPQGDPCRSSARSRISAGWLPRHKKHGLEVALDIAFQCAPDHP